jgi:hypothetical protein
MREIEQASAELINCDGSIQQGKIGKVDEWEKNNPKNAQDQAALEQLV